MTKSLKEITKLIKEDKFSINDLEKVINNYPQYNLRKSEARRLIKIFEKNYLANFGILNRKADTQFINSIKKSFDLKGIIINDTEDISQSIQIGDELYVFDINQKVKKALS